MLTVDFWQLGIMGLVNGKKWSTSNVRLGRAKLEEREEYRLKPWGNLVTHFALFGLLTYLVSISRKDQKTVFLQSFKESVIALLSENGSRVSAPRSIGK